jgi:hypothetical protein
MSLDALVLLGLLSAVIHWLIARANITHWFWGSPRLPTFLQHLLACAACSGFWIGLGLGIVGIQPIASGLLGVLASGLLGVFTTPVFEGVLLWGLRTTHLD